jgi:ABC-type nitrate/sulfonate/bicarbonate transport system permease component
MAISKNRLPGSRCSQRVKGIEPVPIRASRNLGASPRKLLVKVVLMGALPSIFNGVRVGLSVAWMVLVAAELVAATSGLGYMIQDARNFLRTDIIFMGMFMIGFMGILMDMLLEFGAPNAPPGTTALRRFERR